MATFGQGINASLGRIDYSPFLQGASQGAQMRAQGMQQLGAGLAQGIEKFTEISKQNKQKEAVVKDGIKFIETMQKLPGISTEIKQMSASLLETLHSPKASLDDRFTAVQGSSQKLNMLMGLGQQKIDNDFKAKQAEIQAALAAAELQRANAALTPKPQPLSFKEQAVETAKRAWQEKNPGQQMTNEVLSDIYGKVERMGAPPVVNFGPLEAGTVGQYDAGTGEITVKQVGNNPAAQKRKESEENAASLLSQVKADYTELSRLGAIRDSTKSAGSNIANYVASSGIGQEFGKVIGTKEQVLREKINQAIPLLVQDFKNATGMTAQQMNSDKDVQFLKDAIGNPSVDINVAYATIQRLEQRMAGKKPSSDDDEDIRKEFGLK